MKLAIEWFLNPDHLPLIIAKEKGFLARRGIDSFEIVVPTEHYDGLNELAEGRLAFATNEPLHLIEQYHDNFLSLGTYFQTEGGVIMKTASYARLREGGSIRVATPVSNEKTNAIGSEIIRRFAARDGVTVRPDQIEFCARDFYLIKHMKEGLDAGWLYFYNFEGLEAAHEGLDVVHMNSTTAGFANFCALDLFTSKTFYREERAAVDHVVDAVREAIAFIHAEPEESARIYYAYSGQERTELSDAILRQTATCFRPDFASDHRRELPILEFFREIGITDLPEEKFRQAFLA